MIQKYLIGALGGLLALIAAYFYGVNVGKAHVRAEMADDLEKAARALRRANQAIADARVEVARREARRQQITREVYREIPAIVRGDPVYRNVCIGNDGVRLLDKAAAAANGRDPGGPASGAAAASDGGAERGSGDGEAER